MKLKKVALLLATATLFVVGSSACSMLNKGEKAETSSGVEKSEMTNETEALKPVKDYGTVKLGQYKGIQIVVDNTEVSDEEVENQLRSFLDNNPTRTEVTDRVTESGDIVNINYVGKKDGVAFDGGTADNYDLTLGSNQFIPGFEEGLIGLNKGDTKTLELTFPESYHAKDLAGAAVTFDVTINGIFKESQAELTDEWVNDFTGGEQKTIEEYRAFLKESLVTAKQKNSEQHAQQQALMSVLDSSEFTPSQEAIDYEFKNYVNQHKEMASSSGQSYEDFVRNNFNMSIEELEGQFKTYGEQSVKQKLVINEIFKTEKMSLEDEDYARITELYGIDKESLIAEYGQEVVDYSAKAYKVLKYIVDNAEKSEMPAETVMSETVAETQSEETSEFAGESMSEEANGEAQESSSESAQ